MVSAAAAQGRDDPPFDVLVHGSGIVGCASALALQGIGCRVAVASEPAPCASTDANPSRVDVRTYAINRASQELLARVGAWSRLRGDSCTPIYDMHVEGDRAGSSIDFSAWQQRERELAWIVDASELEAALREQVEAAAIARVADDGGVEAALRVVAQGRVSALRDRLGVRFERHDYGQSAVAARLIADRPHAHTARQWFLAPDVLALLPFDRPQPGRSFGLVWSVATHRARELATMPPEAFEGALVQATQGAAGALRLGSGRASWPLAIGRADRVVGPGWVVVGDAAHVVHPLAGQGLNLGLGDVVALAQVVAAREPWRALGDERLLARYERQRAWPVALMSGATDALQLLFAHPSPLARELRNRGLSLVDSMSGLKRRLAAEAFGR
jgi:2-polyprenyl-6-methoxyphenol hydroxylase-like FAD-dependent oxidoreductase